MALLRVGFLRMMPPLTEWNQNHEYPNNLFTHFEL